MIRLDEVHKFMKHEAPFGAACGHHQWSGQEKKLAELSSTSESRQSWLGLSRLFITGIAICEIAMRYGPSDHRRSRPLIRLDEVYKFAKYEAPFGAAYGHGRWSAIMTWSVKILYHRNAKMRDHEIKTRFSARSQPVGIWIKRKTLRTPSNSAGEFKYDRRSTSSLHS